MKKIKSKTGIKLFLIILGICLIIYIFIFNIRNSNHYDIKKDSLMWTLLMENDIVSGYPIISPLEDAEYDWKGDNNTPHSITEWNIEYISNESEANIINQSIKYLEKYNYDLNKSNGIACTWEYFENTSYYSTTQNEDCITIALTRETDNKIRVRFYFISKK